MPAALPATHAEGVTKSRSGGVCDALFENRNLAIERVVHVRPYVGLEDELDAGGFGGDGFGGAFDDVHDLVPFSFDHGVHGVGAVGEAGFADDLHRVGNVLRDGFFHAHGGQGESDEHGVPLSVV